MPESEPKPFGDGEDRAGSRYYLALDGLRAVAVLMVFCQHYGAAKGWIFGWGWTGVDVFFVLSGFLITGILYDSQNKAHRYRDFYIRRTLRIFPLYYAVWLAIWVIGPWAHWQWNWRWVLWPAYVGNYARFLFLHMPGDPYQFAASCLGLRLSTGLEVRCICGLVTSGRCVWRSSFIWCGHSSSIRYGGGRRLSGFASA